MLIEKLYEENNLSKNELRDLLENNIDSPDARIFSLALKTKERYYGKSIFFRGLIEFTNYCKNNCFYCGIRAGNPFVNRYRLSLDEIMSSCQRGYDLGFKTFVLQGGDDPYFDDDKIVKIVKTIRDNYPELAITLSIGEKPYESYKRYKEAGVDRYLLRHETANEEHYSLLHPRDMDFKSREGCLYDLKDLGFQVGAGFMVGSPHQTIDNLIEDLLFLKKLNPEMVGIGPFLAHERTIFKDYDKGDIDVSLLMLAITRLLLPKVLLPATTALETLETSGREKGFMAGANVVMPNISPKRVRNDYNLYDNKVHSGLEDGEAIEDLKKSVERAGYRADMSRGDYIF